jgi:hypothetical protein
MALALKLGPFKAKNKFPAWILRVSVETPVEDKNFSKSVAVLTIISLW